MILSQSISLIGFWRFCSFFTINICWTIVRLPWSVTEGLMLAVASAVGKAGDGDAAWTGF
jgi:hypothetical protein